jgi:hypothetical protein
VSGSAQPSGGGRPITSRTRRAGDVRASTTPRKVCGRSVGTTRRASAARPRAANTLSRSRTASHPSRRSQGCEWIPRSGPATRDVLTVDAIPCGLPRAAEHIASAQARPSKDGRPLVRPAGNGEQRTSRHAARQRSLATGMQTGHRCRSRLDCRVRLYAVGGQVWQAATPVIPVEATSRHSDVLSMHRLTPCRSVAGPVRGHCSEAEARASRNPWFGGSPRRSMACGSRWSGMECSTWAKRRDAWMCAR